MKALRPEPLDTVKIEDLIESYLGTSTLLEILPEADLHLALHNFVEKDENNAISEYPFGIANISDSFQRR